MTGPRRIGLVGPNGAGKTTLLRLISGQSQPDEGSLSTAGMTVGYLEQETQEVHPSRSVLDEAMLAFEHILDLEKEESRLLSELEEHSDHEDPTHDRLLVALERVHDRQHAMESHRIRPRTEAILSGLGFEAGDQLRPVASFSGGWRMRVALARLLLSDPDVLLLDEPTNHLDIDSIDWLENYLRGYPGSVVIVSHDRYFLDRMVTGIAELSRGRLTEYAGNYEYYLTEREERRNLERASYENQQRLITDTKRFIERFRAKATKARQVQSRVKMLDNLVRIPPPPADEATISIRIPDPPRSGRFVIELSEFSKSYPGEDAPIEVFRGAGALQIERGDRIALIGRNGAGKSTLARMLQGTEPFEGSRQIDPRTRMSFFAQNQAETLPQDWTILEVLRETAHGQSETWIRSLLGAFLFEGDDVFKPISVLSGGERSRVALARTLISPANFLILDEPTNHLDIQSRGVLVDALKQYSGTFVVVSHDRHFLDQIVDKIWRAEDGEIRIFHGNYSDYQWQIKHGTASRIVSTQPSSPQKKESVDDAGPARRASGPKSREQKRQEAKERERKVAQRKRGRQNEYSDLNAFQLKKEYDQTEATILKKETERSDLETLLADPQLFEDHKRASKVTRNLDRIQSELQDWYGKWESIAEEIGRRD